MTTSNQIVANAIMAHGTVATNAFDPMAFFNQGQREREELLKLKRQLLDLLEKFDMKRVSTADDYENAVSDLSGHKDIPNADLNLRVARELESKLWSEGKYIDAFRKQLLQMG